MTVEFAKMEMEAGQFTVSPRLGLTTAVIVSVPAKLLMLFNPTVEETPEAPTFRLVEDSEILKSETVKTTVAECARAPLDPVTTTGYVPVAEPLHERTTVLARPRET